MRKAVAESKPEPKPKPEPITAAADPDDAESFAERIFTESEMFAYRKVRGFIELYDIVRPENRARVVRIVEGLVAKV
jgi:hypothetical protein